MIRYSSMQGRRPRKGNQECFNVKRTISSDREVNLSVWKEKTKEEKD